MNLVQYNVDSDGLLLQHEGISSCSAEDAPMRF